MSNFAFSRMGGESESSYSESYRSNSESSSTVPVSKLVNEKNAVAEFDFEHMKEGISNSIVI